jgi:hypothetical protein
MAFFTRDDVMNRPTRQGPRRQSGLWRRRALAAAGTGILLLAYAERQFLARVVVELLLHLASLAG